MDKGVSWWSCGLTSEQISVAAEEWFWEPLILGFRILFSYLLVISLYIYFYYWLELTSHFPFYLPVCLPLVCQLNFLESRQVPSFYPLLINNQLEMGMLDPNMVPFKVGPGYNWVVFLTIEKCLYMYLQCIFFSSLYACGLVLLYSLAHKPWSNMEEKDRIRITSNISNAFLIIMCWQALCFIFPIS